MTRSSCRRNGATATRAATTRAMTQTRAARIARMKALGILDPEATVFPRLPTVPAWNDLPPDEKRKSARRMELYAAMVENMDANIGKLIGYLKTARPL